MNHTTAFRWLLSSLLALLTAGMLQAQDHKFNDVRVLKKIDAPPVICNFVEEHYDTHVPLREAMLERVRNGRLEEKSNFEAIYASNYPGQARPAMEYAMDIWSMFLPSDVTIYVNVTFLEQEGGTLASAGPTGLYLIEQGLERAFYAAPLAEKLAGRSLNSEGEADINIFVGNRDDWYYGLDGNPAPNEFDLATILLHELAHGLGFTGSANLNGRTGELGGATAANPDEIIPYAYDIPVENQQGARLFGDFANPSTNLGDQLVGGALFFNAPMSVAALGERPQLYAPGDFSRGSSYSHLDEFAYPAGDENSLMSPQVGFGEVIHDPGITFQLFADLGWIATRIIHDPLGDTENQTTPYPVVAEIVSDTTYSADSVLLTYSYDDFSSAATVPMNSTGNPNEFAAEIPNNGTDITVSYFISVPDATGRTSTSPGGAPEEQVHSFSVGNDTEPPVIEHDPIPFIVTTATTVDIIAAVSDNLDVPPTVIVEYSLNGEEQEPIVMDLDPEPRLQFVEQTYSSAFTFEAGQLNEGDEIQYRILAVDGSQNENSASAPADGSRFVVPIESVASVADSYENDFEDPATASDFIGESFIYDQPSGFDDVALHSPHPYEFADNIGQSSINYIHQLKVPIRVAEDRLSAVISFNEIVLVEPGEPNAEFGEDEFWDYVIVEGSNDNGTTWEPLLDGYDCRAQRTWESTYNDELNGADSEAEGNEGLFREREINIQNTFDAGEEILIRFRLFSDPFARGWGWAIDDLRIQVAKPLEAPVAKEAENVTEDGFTAAWFAVRNAETYLLDVATDENFSNFVAGYENREIDGFNEGVTGLEAGETYFYRVRAKAGEQVSPNSNVISVTLGTATGIEEYVTETGFTLYPNPTNGELSLDIDFIKPAESLKVRVTDMLGKTLVQEQFQPNSLSWQQRLSLDQEAAGFYLVTIEVEGGTMTKKVLLTR